MTISQFLTKVDQNLVKEHNDLKVRLGNLREFLKTFKFTDLPKVERADLIAQEGFMTRYQETLQKRIARQQAVSQVVTEITHESVTLVLPGGMGGYTKGDTTTLVLSKNQAYLVWSALMGVFGSDGQKAHLGHTYSPSSSISEVSEPTPQQEAHEEAVFRAKHGLEGF